MAGPFGWRGATRRKAQKELRRSYKQRLIYAACGKAGCIFCRERLETLDTHFFWYLNELYFEPIVIERTWSSKPRRRLVSRRF